jgi:hypothetical protein
LEAHEAFERFETTHHGAGHDDHAGGGLTRVAALMVAIIAALLAIATFLGNESSKEAIQKTVEESNTKADKRAFDVQELVFNATQLNLIALGTSSDQQLSAASKAGNKELDKFAKGLPAVAKQKDEKTKEVHKDVTHANDQHLLYELAAVLLQIGIVLASVAIIAQRRFLLMGSGSLASIGVVVLVIGYLT